MAIENNPLKQYFRRPNVYLKLPSKGLGYGPNVINMPENGEIPIYPMTAIDEISSKTPDSLYNGSAVADIIRSCVPCILDPWAILSVDLDAILVGIRIATNGNEMDIDTTCPSCSEEQKFGMNLSFVLNNFVAGNYSTPLNLGDLQVKFRPLNYKELTDSSIRQFEIQKLLMNVTSLPDGEEKDIKSGELMKVISNSTIAILAGTIDAVMTPDMVVTEKAYIIDFLQNTDKNVFEKIKDASMQLRETTQIKPLHITCSSCSHEYDQTFTLNVSDFFE